MRAICRTLALALLGLLAVGVTTAQGLELPSGFQDEQLPFQGLNEPTNFKFAPDGRVFVALKNGEILVYSSIEDPTPTLFADLRKPVYDNHDHGLLGLALDPNFAVDHQVYALYTYDHVLGKTPADGVEGQFPRWGSAATEYEGDPCPDPQGCMASGRLVRLTAEGDHALPSAAAPEEHVLVEDWCQQYFSHSIGDLQFGPEGALFASAGDAANYETADFGQFGNRCGDPPGQAGEDLSPPTAEGGSLRAQDVRTLADPTGLDGSLIRIDPGSGEAWPGNPLAASGDANARRIVAFGFRNPFRFTVDPGSGEVFVGNVGSGTDEEIDRFPIGSAQPYNSGWPCYEGIGPSPDFQAFGLDSCQALYTQPGSTSPPFFYYTHSSPVAPGDPCPFEAGSAITGMSFYEGSQYPAEYRHALFFSDAIRGCIYVMFAGEDGQLDPSDVVAFLSEFGEDPAVDMEQGPEGDLFFASLYGNSIHRISYDPGAPRARIGVDREWGSTPLTVEFSAAGSTASPGAELEYEWDLDGDGEFDDGTQAVEEETYNTADNVDVALRVTDPLTGKQSKAKLRIYPGDSPPAVEVSQPQSSFTWGVEQPVQFAGGAVADGGAGAAIPTAGLYWKVHLLHCPFDADACHEHPLQVFPSTESGEFSAPSHEYPSALRISLTATDARGLAQTRTVEIKARPEPLDLVSNPPGIRLTAGLETAPAPFRLEAIENARVTISAPSTAVVGGTEYAFSGWSDHGTRVHNVVAAAPTTYVATYTAAAIATATAGALAPELSLRPRIAHRPARVTAVRTARFAFSSASPGASFYCRLDRRPSAECHSPRIYRNLKPGRHSFRVFAVDGPGAKASAAAEAAWRILAPASVRRGGSR